MKCTRPRQTEPRNSTTKKDDSKRAEFPVIASLECTKGESPVAKLQPSFCPDIPILGNLGDVSEAIGPESWFLLTVAEVDPAFLQKPVEEWGGEHSYVKLKNFIKNMSVVNDVSERGVKLIQEYVDSARGEDLRQDILTVSKEFKSKVNSRNFNKDCCYSFF